MPRDYKQCPMRLSARLDEKDGQEHVRCAGVAPFIGLPHSITETGCRICANNGPADITNAYVRSFVILQLKTRIFCSEFHDGAYPPEQTKEAAFSRLLSEGFTTNAEAKDVLREAVRRGLDPNRAADMADAEKLEEEPVELPR